MTTPITLRIQQRGYIRASGYQAVQWAVTVPISVPPGSPPIATDPLSFAPMFVVRNVGGFETLERIATIKDLNSLALRQLVYFDIRGQLGNVGLTLAQPGQTLTITNPPDYWLEADPPYDTAQYAVKDKVVRASGTNATGAGQSLSIPDYPFSPADVGRWIYLSGFAFSQNNGWAQILNYLGTVAQVSKTFVSNDTGNWTFYAIEIEPAIPGSEPKFFPTATGNLDWTLSQGPTVMAQGTGGVTFRSPAPGPLFATTRFTMVVPTVKAIDDLFLVTRKQVDDLQRSATEVQTQFLTTITHTVGP